MEDHQQMLACNSRIMAKRHDHERSLITSNLRFEVRGFCYVCSRKSAFSVSEEYSYEIEGERVPNWREHLRCVHCGMNNRMRATIQILEERHGVSAEDRIYLTEMVTPLHNELKKRLPHLTGSEFLRDGTPKGNVNNDGVRHEDLTDLSFADSSFDAVLSFDVLEHVPRYLDAIAQCARVLVKGGLFFFSVPFLSDRRENVVRAEISHDGTIIHHLPAEYHGDPLSGDGCLSYYHFGWEILDHLHELGFEDARAHEYWSKRFAYLGQNQMMFSARRR